MTKFKDDKEGKTNTVKNDRKVRITNGKKLKDRFKAHVLKRAQILLRHNCTMLKSIKKK